MDSLRQHVIGLLHGGQAFDTLEEILGEFKPEERGVVPEGAEHSAWQILEHMRRALRDILEFTGNEDGSYREKVWPEEYWPKETLGDWDGTANSYKRDLAEMERLVADPDCDLFRAFAWGSGQTLLREALLAADHAAYHLGELVQLHRWVARASGDSPFGRAG